MFLSNPFGGIGVICVSKLRTLHADVPTLTAHRSSLIAQDPKTCSFVLLSKIKICGHLSNLCHQRANENLLQNRISV